MVVLHGAWRRGIRVGGQCQRRNNCLPSPPDVACRSIAMSCSSIFCNLMGEMSSVAADTTSQPPFLLLLSLSLNSFSPNISLCI